MSQVPILSANKTLVVENSPFLTSLTIVTLQSEFLGAKASAAFASFASRQPKPDASHLPSRVLFDPAHEKGYRRLAGS